MAANNTSNLDIKIIPVVIKSNIADELVNAKKIYDDALNAGGLIETLNKKSLNQAGINCTYASVRPISSPRATPRIDDNTEYIIVDTAKDNWDKFYQGGKYQDWKYAGATVPPLISEDEDGNADYTTKNPNNMVKYFLDKLKEDHDCEFPGDFKGALIFVTDKDYLGDPPAVIDPTDPYKPPIAYSFNNPLRNNGVVVFDKGVKEPDVYAHELGHMLGLEHTFFHDADDLNKINSRLTGLTRGATVAAKKAELKGYIVKCEQDISKSLMDIEVYKKRNSDGDKKRIEREKELIEGNKNSIKTMNDQLQKIDIYTTTANLKVKQGKTKNYMDYINDRSYFHKYQAKMIRDEIEKYYKKILVIYSSIINNIMQQYKKDYYN